MLAFETIRTLWAPYDQLAGPPPEPIRLWGEGWLGIWISNDWGPAVPYPGIDHRDGNMNHGYRPVKADPSAIRRIPEVNGWPELVDFLEKVNAESSPIESVGCENGFFPSDLQGWNAKIGSYVGVIFTNPVLNDRPENLLRLATVLANSVEGCERWMASISLVLERNKALMGAQTPWGLMIRPQNYGRTLEEARRLWADSLARMGKAISALSRDYCSEANGA
jgi:hypothetical protein